jgi:hypothetical protein
MAGVDLIITTQARRRELYEVGGRAEALSALAFRS